MVHTGQVTAHNADRIRATPAHPPAPPRTANGAGPAHTRRHRSLQVSVEPGRGYRARGLVFKRRVDRQFQRFDLQLAAATRPARTDGQSAAVRIGTMDANTDRRVSGQMTVAIIGL